MTNDCLKPQEVPFYRGNLTVFYKEMPTARQTRHLWVASDITPSSESLGLVVDEDCTSECELQILLIRLGLLSLLS